MVNEKGAERKEEKSFILIEFKGTGSADPNITSQNVTLGQMQVASFTLRVMTERNMHEMMSAQQAQAMQERAMLQSLARDGKLRQD